MSSTASNVFARIAVAMAFTLTAAAAGAQDVRYNAMPGTDFAKFKTYTWVKIEGAQYPDQITDAQIKAAIDEQLASKGLTKTDDNNSADLYVGYQAGVSQEKQWNTYGAGGVGWGWGPGYGAYGGGMTTTTTSTIHIGTLGLDLYDRASKQLVWRGTASKTLDPGAKPEKRQKNLSKAMQKLLKNYPPPVKK